MRYAENGPAVAIRASFYLKEVLGQRLEEFKMGRSSRAIVANVGVIRTFFEIDPLHKLRDHRVHVRVALAVRVRRQVQRHIVEENGEIRAVVKIEAPQEILVGLPAAGVLSDDESRNRLQNLSRTQNRAILDLFCAHRSLGAGIGNTDKVVLSTLHVHGGAHPSDCQRDAQRGGRLRAYGDRYFLRFEIGVRYDEPVLACRESGNIEGAARVRRRRRQCGAGGAANLHAGPGNRRAGRVDDSPRYLGVRGPGTPHGCKQDRAGDGRGSGHRLLSFVLQNLESCYRPKMVAPIPKRCYAAGADLDLPLEASMEDSTCGYSGSLIIRSSGGAPASYIFAASKNPDTERCIRTSCLVLFCQNQPCTPVAGAVNDP